VFPLDYLPVTERAGNALIACATYLSKTVWPTGLAVFYPLPTTLPIVGVFAAGAVLLGLTAWAGWSARSRPHVAVGWFWFLGMLVPVIGLVQVGVQQRADRYTYLPLIGVFLVLVWEATKLCRRSVFCGVAAGVALLGCVVGTRLQLRHWQNSERLFRRAIAVTRDNWLAHYNLAEALSQPGHADEARAEYERALAIHPGFARAHNNLGNLLLLRGQADEAIAHWRKALELNPTLAGAHYNLGNVLLGKGQVDEAIAHLQKALELDPSLAGAHNGLGNALLRKGELGDAIAQFEDALRLRPDFARAHCNLAAALLRVGRTMEAAAHIQAALAVQPANPSVLNSVAWMLATCPEASVRNGPRAVELALQATRLPGGENPAVLGTLAAAYAEAGQFPEAVATARRAVTLAGPGANPAQTEALQAQLALYQAGSCYHDPTLGPAAR
jgi:protein O-mannosyl-transferase